MPYKILSQTKPVAATLTDSYTVPASNSTQVQSFFVCNQSSVPTTFRVSVAVAGAADATKQYLHYDIPIAGNNTVEISVAMTLGAADVIRVYATLATLSFNFFGIEIPQ